MEDTIVGVATAAGEGGVAIVRVSGPEAVRLFEEAFRPKGAKLPYESHRLMVGHAVDETGPIDEAMGVVMYAPRSYTREDVCEIHTHGGAAAASLVMRRLVRLGARPAEAGEFTRRAFMNGRIDLMQAEAVMGVISARSAAALRAGERQLEGGQSRFIRKAQEDLTALLSGLEAHIDYPDEIGEDEALSGLCEGLDKLIARLDGAIDERGARIVREGLRVALCGRPNAGKSTLFNALLGEDRAIVTDIPGTTRDVLEGAFMLDGTNVLLQDTAGLRDSGDAVERIGVERARAALGRADVALLVVDAMAGQDAVNVAKTFNETVGVDGIILTKTDGDTRGGAALSVLAVTGKPIKFQGTGEKLDDLDVFHPDRMASRILGMGDVLSLIERAQDAADEKAAEETAKRLMENKFDMNDMLEQFAQIRKMGGAGAMLSMLPGASGIDASQIDDKAFDRIEAMIYSMTKEEREKPSIINPKRKRRIAAGSGTRVEDVNKLLKQFEMMQKMMKQFKKSPKGFARRLGGMMGNPNAFRGLK
mgnify:CR=1 FL=1